MVASLFFLFLPALSYSESDVAKLKNTGWKFLVFEGASMELLEQIQNTSMCWCFYDESHFAVALGASAGIAGYLVISNGARMWAIEKEKSR